MSELEMRRSALMQSREAVDWESIARGMVDSVTEFELTEYKPTNFGNYQFLDRRGLKAVVIDNLTSLGQACFSGCSALESITLPSNLVNIQFQAFGGCTSLKSITIPASVTTIGQYAFNNCRTLEFVVLESTTPPSIASYSFNGTTCNFYVPDASLNDYKTAANWSSLASRIFSINDLNT